MSDDDRVRRRFVIEVEGDFSRMTYVSDVALAIDVLFGGSGWEVSNMTDFNGEEGCLVREEPMVPPAPTPRSGKARGPHVEENLSAAVRDCEDEVADVRSQLESLRNDVDELQRTIDSAPWED